MAKMGMQTRAIRRRAIVTMIDDVTLDDDPTNVNSDSLDVSPWTDFLLYLSVLSANTPTTVQFIVQFSDDGGSTWYSYLQGLFASLFYEDGDTATVVRECFSGKVQGRDMRIRAVGVGTGASNTFTISAKLDLWS